MNILFQGSLVFRHTQTHTSMDELECCAKFHPDSHVNANIFPIIIRQFPVNASLSLSLYLSVSSHLFRNIPSRLSHRILNFPISCHLNFRLWSEFELAFSRWAQHLLIEMDVIDVSFFSFDLICTHVEPTTRSCSVIHIEVSIWFVVAFV